MHTEHLPKYILSLGHLVKQFSLSVNGNFFENILFLVPTINETFRAVYEFEKFTLSTAKVSLGQGRSWQDLLDPCRMRCTAV